MSDKKDVASVPVVEGGLTLPDFKADAYSAFAGSNEETGSVLPVLKINYRIDSKIAKPGEFVLGQKISRVTDEKTGKTIQSISEEGVKVSKMLILKVRKQYNFYDDKDTRNNCRSKIFKPFETGMRGNNYGNLCGPDCPYREKNLNPHCNAQINVYAKAFVEVDGKEKLVDCSMFLHGVAYMPFDGFYNDLIKGILINGVKTKVPVFGAVVSLDSFPEQKGSIPYYVPKFKVTGLVPETELPELEKTLEVVLDYIDNQNRIIMKKPNDDEDSGDEGEDSDSAIVDATGSPVKNEELEKMLNEEVS
jgi:hypothetical protein